MNMNYFISVVGTTSTGKTNYAFSLADTLLLKKEVAGVVLLSADSRQVYKGLEILSGADIPGTFSRESSPELKYSFFTHLEKQVFLHGQSIIDPDEEWSVAHFKKLADELIVWCDERNYVLIVVGGTGLYQSQLISKDPAVFVGPNEIIRNQSTNMTVLELQQWLQKLNNSTFEEMNNSDKNNPRRLVRAIEKSTYISSLDHAGYTSPFVDKKHIIIGLERELDTIQESIKARIKDRILKGAQNEVLDIISLYVNDIPAKSTIGFFELEQYAKDVISLQECEETWVIKELQYAKRQITWWKTHPPSVWLDSQNLDNKNNYSVLIDEYLR